MDTTMTIREIIRKDAQYNPVLRRYALKIMRFMLLDGVNTHVTKIDPTLLRLWWREGWHPRRAVRAMAEEGKLSPLDQYYVVIPNYPNGSIWVSSGKPHIPNVRLDGGYQTYTQAIKSAKEYAQREAKALAT